MGLNIQLYNQIGEFRMIDIDTKLLYFLIINRDFIMFLFVRVSHMIDYLVRLFGDSGLPRQKSKSLRIFFYVNKYVPTTIAHHF